jgi:predicted permease
LAIQSSTQVIVQFGLFYLLILIGYLIARFTGKGVTLNTHLTSLLVKLLLPLLTIYSILTVPPQALSEISKILILTILVHLMGPSILYLRLRRREIDNATKGTFYTCVTFNNALFIPLPLVMIFFGQNGVPYVILFLVVQLFLFASLGSWMGSTFSEKGISVTEIAKRTLVFPPLFAAILATVLHLWGVALPTTFATVLSYTGPLTTYLSLVTVGLGVGTGTSLIRDVRSTLEVVAVRQVIVPLLTLSIVVFSGLSALASQVLLIEAMMPPAVLSVVYAGWFRFNVEKAATIVTLGTLLLLPELPIVLLLIR